MWRYILRRLIQAIPLLIGISLISFFIMRLAPGGPLSGLLTNPKVTPADVARIEHAWGLDQPLHIQYFKWLWSMIRGDWGLSYKTGLPVWQMIVSRLPATFTLMFSAFLLSVTIALPAGILSAVKRYSPADYLVTFLAFLGVALPSFWFGLMLQLLFSVKLGWLPSSGLETIGLGFNVLDRLRHLAMPTIVLALVSIAGWSRYMRSSMLEAIHQDYIRTARAKGLPESAVIGRHALKNAMIPVVTIMGLDLPSWFGGAAITETIFAWPGMGRLYVEAVFGRDYPVLMANLMFTAVLVVVGNLLADILYALLDPRIKYD
ncbi:MAG: ABC transporter permease [Betaproteobacteria bacterium]